MKVTLLKDIAKKAKVNLSTVSRALNDSSLVKKETKQKILTLADALGYYPNALAKGLASQKSFTIGLVLSDMTALQGPFYTEVLKGIEKEADDEGYTLLLTTMENKKKETAYRYLIKGKRMDGILLINENIDIKDFSFLIKDKIPFVVINRYFKEPAINCVVSDNVKGARISTEYLLKLGHRKVGIITGGKSFSASLERLKGFKQALKKGKIPFNANLVVEGSFQNGFSSGYDCTLKLLKKKPKPTAIFTSSDEIALGVYGALKDKNYKIPRDIAVVGFDDTQFATHLMPSLTTVKQYGQEIGSQACGMLIDVLNKKSFKLNKIKIPTKLIIRDSCSKTVTG